MKNVCWLAIFVLAVFWNFGFAQNPANILVVYYSVEGHTRQMAEAVVTGARGLKDVEVKLLSVTEATTSDLLLADAIIVGSPVYNANAAPPVQEFMTRWPFSGSPMKDKIGAAFVSAGGISAGEELTQVNILHSMMIYGMIVVGGPDWKGAFGASAIMGEEPFDKDSKEKKVQEYFLKKAEALGRRVAELALKFKCLN